MKKPINQALFRSNLTPFEHCLKNFVALLNLYFATLTFAFEDVINLNLTL